MFFIDLFIFKNGYFILSVNFNELYREALERDDEVGEKLRTFGPSNQLKAEIVRRRIMKKVTKCFTFFIYLYFFLK